MSKSYSKIRHMKEANLMLERRMMNKRMLLEDYKEGDIEASPREPEQIASGMRDAVFQVYNYKGQKGQQYFYTCVSNRDLPLDKQTWDQKTGAISDGSGKSVTASQLKLLPGWEGKLSVACKSQYDNLANWRKTFCANLKNKTKPNYDWNCPEAAKPDVAAVETPVAPVVQTPEQIAAKKAEEVKKDQKMLEDLTNFENLRLFFLDKEDGTLRTDQELEADVKTWNDYLTGQGKDEYSIGQGGNLTVGELSQRAAKYLRGRIASFMKMKPTLTRPNGGYKVIKTGTFGES
jgi:hypothetical protein